GDGQLIVHAKRHAQRGQHLVPRSPAEALPGRSGIAGELSEQLPHRRGCELSAVGQRGVPVTGMVGAILARQPNVLQAAALAGQHPRPDVGELHGLIEKWKRTDWRWLERVCVLHSAVASVGWSAFFDGRWPTG